MRNESEQDSTNFINLLIDVENSKNFVFCLNPWAHELSLNGNCVFLINDKGRKWKIKIKICVTAYPKK